MAQGLRLLTLNLYTSTWEHLSRERGMASQEQNNSAPLWRHSSPSVASGDSFEPSSSSDLNIINYIIPQKREDLHTKWKAETS